jgi:hypothetical protein
MWSQGVPQTNTMQVRIRKNSIICKISFFTQSHNPLSLWLCNFVEAHLKPYISQPNPNSQGSCTHLSDSQKLHPHFSLSNLITYRGLIRSSGILRDHRLKEGDLHRLEAYLGIIQASQYLGECIFHTFRTWIFYVHYDLYAVVMILICLLFKTDVYHESYVDLKF